MRAMNETSAGQTTCAAFWVKDIAETLEAAGLDIPALFEEAELELAALSDADARFPTEGISRLWQLAATRSGNPAIGLMNSSDVKPELRCCRIRDDVVPKSARHPRAGCPLCRYPKRRGYPHHCRR